MSAPPSQRGVAVLLAVGAALLCGCTGPPDGAAGAPSSGASGRAKARTTPPSLPTTAAPRTPTAPPTTEGTLAGRDAAAIGAMYAFAVDPAQNGPFAPGTLRLGLADGRTWATLRAADRSRRAAWRIGTAYAERDGPFSALDVLVASRGRYEMREGTPTDCPAGSTASLPAALGRVPGLHAVSLATPSDPATTCADWWAVTLLLDADSRVHAVVLRLGSP